MEKIEIKKETIEIKSEKSEEIKNEDKLVSVKEDADDKGENKPSEKDPILDYFYTEASCLYIIHFKENLDLIFILTLFQKKSFFNFVPIIFCLEMILNRIVSKKLLL